MQKYKLIAFDMDGTLLNSEKKISAVNLKAISDASNAGIIVILATGRCPIELNQYIDILPWIRYLDCSSGALIYDIYNKKPIYKNYLQPRQILKILDVIQNDNVMIHMLSDNFSIVQKSHLKHMEQFGMGVYKDMFRKLADSYDDLFSMYRKNPFDAAKFNIYCDSKYTRYKIEQKLTDINLDVTMAHAESTSLEINSIGVSKGTGLLKLCEALNIPVNQTIAVGDAGNDIDIMKTAGLSIAMANSTPEILEIADFVVADCDHNGCAEAIYEYAL